jgi:hypothetical protein
MKFATMLMLRRWVYRPGLFRHTKTELVMDAKFIQKQTKRMNTRRSVVEEVDEETTPTMVSCQDEMRRCDDKCEANDNPSICNNAAVK